MTTLFTKIAVPVTLLVASALITTGCGDSTAAASNVSEGDAMGAFQSCLQEQGVELPQGGGPGGDAPNGRPDGGAPAGGPPPGGAGGAGGGMNDEQRAAFEKCRDKMPNGGQRPQMTEAQQKQMDAQRAKLESCLAKAGVEMPTRPSGDQPPRGGQGGQPPQLDAASQKAMQACIKQVGGFGGPGGQGGPGGPGGARPQGTDPAAAA